MSRATQTKLYRTFVKGLITEASPLTYPEDATINEDNMVLTQSGERFRRKGVDFETDSALIPSLNIVDYAGVGVHQYVWQAPDNQGDKNLLVVQIGNGIYFYDLMGISSISSTKKPYFINLLDFAVGGQNPGTIECQMASGKGYLFIAHPMCDPVLVTYNSTADSISTQKVLIQIRDFKGVDDGLANDQEPTTLSAEHQYNLQNQGWVDPANNGTGTGAIYYSPYGFTGTAPTATSNVITTYHTSIGRYPANNKQWWIAKNATGDFDPTLLSKFYLGNNHSPRGHYVVEAFNTDRSGVSGVSGLPVETSNSRPNCVQFFSGRVWWALNSTVYFSQILDDKSKAGFCHMEADPTSEDINDLIATDGGEIPIPEMLKIQRMTPIAGGMMCFGSNGVWFIGGTASTGFSALDFSVTKVSPVGTTSPNSIVHVQVANNDMVLWWSSVGIQGMNQRYGSFGPIDNKFDSTILSQNTIQQFYNSIPQSSLKYVKAVYDPSQGIVQWLFNDGNAPYNYTYNRILNFDLILKSFYPWTVSARIPNGPYIAGVFNTINPLPDARNRLTKYMVVSPGETQYFYTFGEASNAQFADWGTTPFTSFMETGYELADDAMREKQLDFLYTYFRRTETAYVPSGGDYTVDKPTSCRLQVRWDWSDTSKSNRWSTEVEAYRPTRIPPLDPSNLAYDNGFPVVVTRHKVRGHGKSIQFRFSSNQIGADFQLLGWSVPMSGNTSP